MSVKFHALLPRSLDPGLRKLRKSEVRAYLQAVAAPGIHLKSPGRFEPVLTETNVSVVRWITEERGALYARVWSGRQRKHPVLRHLGAGRALREAGLATPEVLFTDCSARTAFRWGVEAAVETAAPGDPLDRENSDEQIALLADDLARLHAHEGDLWGRPWLPGGSSVRPPVQAWRRRIEGFGKRITPETTDLTADEIRRCLDLLKQGLEAQATRRPTLTHGDLFRGHIFVSGRSLTWIDPETVSFGLPEWDLGSARLWMAPVEFDRLIRFYQERRGEALDERRILASALYSQFKRLYKRIRKSRVARERGVMSSGRLEEQRLGRKRLTRNIRELLGGA